MSTRENYSLVTVYKRKKDASDEEWHEHVTSVMHETFGAIPTLHNFAWIEYKMFDEAVDDCVTHFQGLGFEVTIEKE